MLVASHEDRNCNHDIQLKIKETERMNNQKTY